VNRTYWASLLVPLILIAALAVVIVAALTTHCSSDLFNKGYLLECTTR
jgi:hypothetical protein